MTTLCKSVKNKLNLSTQCCNKPKPGEILCGTHLKSKNVIIFQEQPNNIVLNETNIMGIKYSKCDSPKEVKENTFDLLISESLNNVSKNDVSKNDVSKNDVSKNDVSKNDIIIYTKKELFKKVSMNEYINVGSIRKSIKKSKELNWINTKLSKSAIISIIHNEIEKERFYLSNVDIIIKIQSYVRRWRIMRIKNCSNDSDILTFNSLYDIESPFLYIFYDTVTNNKYGYDFRTIIEIINSDYPSCPYTFRAFTTHEKDYIFKHRDYLLTRGFNTQIEKDILSPEEEVDMRIKDVFHKINMLDNYTNPIWFKNLNMFDLYQLYIRSEDIWNYRSGMSMEAEKKIVSNGYVFTIPPHIIKNMNTKINLQNIILSEFTRMITEGIDREEKKLGAILILTALVEVSIDAADALPHLIQI
jgi:hypothetical protein